LFKINKTLERSQVEAQPVWQELTHGYTEFVNGSVSEATPHFGAQLALHASIPPEQPMI
jgi:hypothetical protein